MKLEDILALQIILQTRAAQIQSEQMKHLIERIEGLGKEGHHYSYMSTFYGGDELEILEESVKWMKEARQLYNRQQTEGNKEYADLTLGEFLAKIRPG